MKVVKLNDPLSPKISDEEIVRRVLSGEKEWYEVLLRRHNQTLFRIIRGYLGNEDVEDVMQETYLKAYEKLDKFRGEAAFSTWLIRIAINESLRQVKQKNKLLKMYDPKNSEDEKLVQLPATGQLNPEQQILRREMNVILESAIDQLPAKLRSVYMLREVEGMSIEDTAACLELSESNVKVRLHRAKALLKEKLYELSAGKGLFEFGNKRCDRVVEHVMSRIG